MDRYVFRYQLTEDHMRPGARWLLWHRFGKVFVIRFLVTILMIALAGYHWVEEPFGVLATMFTVIAVVSVIGVCLFYPRVMKALMRTRLLGMEQVATIDRTGLDLTGPGLHIQLEWSLMFQIVARENGLLVQPDLGSYWWLPFDRADSEVRKEELGALLTNLPVKVRG